MAWRGCLAPLSANELDVVITMLPASKIKNLRELSMKRLYQVEKGSELDSLGFLSVSLPLVKYLVHYVFQESTKGTSARHIRL